MFLKICLVTICLNYFSMFGQVIKGKVIDAENLSPIANASVYIDGSTIGTITNAEGYFEINTRGFYEPNIIISIINYHTANINKAGENFFYTVKLPPKVFELTTVIVESDKNHRNLMLKYFKENFIGQNEASSKFKIKNEDDLILNFDKENKTLYGSAFQALILINEYLGYEIKFDLQEFEIKFKNSSLKNGIIDEYYSSGTTFYKDISNGKNKYSKRRKKAYFGSTMHLFQSIYHNQTKENGFKFYYNKYEISLDSLFERKDSLNLVYLRYKKEDELIVLYEKNFRTDIYFLDKEIIISSEGNYYPPRALNFNGYMTRHKAGLLLPLDYKKFN